jgi:hypothetical protein
MCLVLSACQKFSPDGGMDVVASIAGSELDKDVAALRTPEAEEAARARVSALLRRPLTADAAVQTALLNNRGLQAAYNELGIAEAVMVEASLPPSPTISLSALSTPVELDIERSIVLEILALATLEARTEIARERFRQAQPPWKRCASPQRCGVLFSAQSPRSKWRISWPRERQPPRPPPSLPNALPKAAA